MTSICPITEKATARRNMRLLKSPMVNTDFVCDLQLKALNMSKKTKQVNVMVVSLGVTIWSLISFRKINKVPRMMMSEDNTTLNIRSLVIMGCLVLRGGCFNTSWSTGSTPRLCAGGPSMMMFIQRICIAFRGLGIFISVDNAIKERAAMLVLSWNVTKFLML